MESVNAAGLFCQSGKYSAFVALKGLVAQEAKAGQISRLLSALLQKTELNKTIILRSGCRRTVLVRSSIANAAVIFVQYHATGRACAVHWVGGR